MSEEDQRTQLLSSARCRMNHKVYLYFLVFVAAIGGALFGYDTGVVSGAMLLISKDFNLNSWQHELVVSSTIALAAIGSLFSDLLNRLYGRRPVLLAGSIVFTGGAWLMAVAQTFAELVLGRMVVGIAVGLASSTVPMFIAELAPPERRGALVSLNSVCIVLGQVIASLVDGAFGGVPQGWRYMLGLGGVPSTIQFFGLLLLPESPRWLLSAGRDQQARRVLRRLLPPGPDLEEKLEEQVHEMIESLKIEGVSCAGDTTGAVASQPPRSRSECRPGRSSNDDAAVTAARAAEAAGTQAVDIQAADTHAGEIDAKQRGAFNSPSTGSSRPATRRRRQDCTGMLAKLWRVRRQLQLGVGLQLLQQLIGINTIMYYSGSILQQSFYGHAEPSDEQRQVLIWLTAPVATAQLVGCIGGLFLVDRKGRRSLVLFSLAGVAVTLAVEGAAFGIDEWYCGASQTTQSEGFCSITGWISLFAMAAYLVFFGLGMAPVPWLVNAEIYPLDMRSTCVSIATAVNWIANLVVAASFLSLEEAVSRPATFWLYGCFAVLGGVYLMFRMPETAGKSLEEIEPLFHSPRQKRAAVAAVPGETEAAHSSSAA